MVCGTLHITYVHYACCIQCVVLYDAWYMLYSTYHGISILKCCVNVCPGAESIQHDSRYVGECNKAVLERESLSTGKVLLRGVSMYVCTYLWS